MKYHTLFFSKLRKLAQNLSFAAVVIGALRVKVQENLMFLPRKLFLTKIKGGRALRGYFGPPMRSKIKVALHKFLLISLLAQ